MSSNPLIMGYGRWRPDCCWLPWPVVGPSLCVAVQFSDESALGVCNRWYALYKSTFLPYLFYYCPWPLNAL